MLKIAIAGAGGRMGRTLIEAVLAPDSGARLHAALEQPTSPLVGQDAGALVGKACGVAISADVGMALAGTDVLIDFTRPAGTLAHLELCAEHGVRAVVGTTGLDADDKLRLQALAQRTAIVLAPNMSIGVNVLLDLVREAAARLGPGYDIEVIEAHHRHKVDAPSGTAIALGQAAAAGRGLALDRNGVFARHGHTGERRTDDIGFATVRGGDIVGEHTVMFAGTGERIELTHRSSSRANYAEGSLRAAHFVARQSRGLFAMADVLAAG
jgi:4-hydroxy-tetrahydrodipicolinate reductase